MGENQPTSFITGPVPAIVNSVILRDPTEADGVPKYMTKGIHDPGEFILGSEQ